MTQLTDPKWLAEARKNMGVARIGTLPGNPQIIQYWKDIKRGGIKDEKTSWCSAFVGAMFERVGIQSTRFESARSWLEWGKKIPGPAYGCVVVFSREGGGHVGFVVGRRMDGALLVLGGNQGSAVCIKAFGLDRVLGYRWPSDYPVDDRPLPDGSAATSTNEA